MGERQTIRVKGGELSAILGEEKTVRNTGERENIMSNGRRETDQKY